MALDSEATANQKENIQFFFFLEKLLILNFEDFLNTSIISKLEKIGQFF